jgi:hypothetical protein
MIRRRRFQAEMCCLRADIRDIGKREGPPYAELKDNDGDRLLGSLALPEYAGVADRAPTPVAMLAYNQMTFCFAPTQRS